MPPPLPGHWESAPCCPWFVWSYGRSSAMPANNKKQIVWWRGSVGVRRAMLCCMLGSPGVTSHVTDSCLHDPLQGATSPAEHRVMASAPQHLSAVRYVTPVCPLHVSPAGGRCVPSPPPLRKHGQGQKNNGDTGSPCLDKPVLARDAQHKETLHTENLPVPHTKHITHKHGTRTQRVGKIQRGPRVLTAHQQVRNRNPFQPCASS